MIKYTLKITSDFTDAITGQLRQRGTTLETDDLARYHQIRAVYSTEGIAPTLCAGMGAGGSCTENNGV